VDLVLDRVRHYGERRRSAEFISRFVERARLVRAGATAVATRIGAAPDRGRIIVEDLVTAAYMLFVSVVSVSYDVAVTKAPADVIERVRAELGAMAMRYLLGTPPTLGSPATEDGAVRRPDLARRNSRGPSRSAR
jgi:hypothetical protein